jgi:SSS family solute:Na+ symporter
MGTVMFGTALGLHALTGWSLPTIIVVTGLVVTLYTLLGGIRAVVWTDVVQSIILMVGAVTVLSLLLAGMPGGPRQAVTIAAEHGKFNLGGFGGGVGQSTFWVVLLYGIFTNLNNFGIDQNYIQRYIVASSDRAAVRSVWVGALLYVPVSLIFFFIGSSLFSYYREHDGQLEALRSPATAASLSAADSSGPADADIADRVLPHFIVHKLRYGLAGLVIAAIFAAAMSTIDTSLNSSATVFLCDIWRRHVSPDISEAGAMRVLYAFTFMWGLVGTSAALAMIGVKSLLDTWWQISGMIAGAMLGLFLLGVLCKRAGPASAGIGVIAGLAAIAWAKMSPNSNLPPGLRSPLHPNLVIVVGTLTILSVGFVASRIVDRNTLRDLRKRPAMEAPASRSVPS